MIKEKRLRSRVPTGSRFNRERTSLTFLPSKPGFPPIIFPDASPSRKAESTRALAVLTKTIKIPARRREGKCMIQSELFLLRFLLHLRFFGRRCSTLRVPGNNTSSFLRHFALGGRHFA